MATTDRAATKVEQPEEFLVFPDPPEVPEDQMTNFDHLAANGNVLHLTIHFGNPDTTLVAGERYLALAPTRDLTGLRYPDLLIAFDVDPAAYRRRRAYVIEDQGKPPDFVMEVASPSARRIDATTKRNDYAALGIPEYWRFDETLRGRGPRLAGDRLAGSETVCVAFMIAQDPTAMDVLHMEWAVENTISCDNSAQRISREGAQFTVETLNDLFDAGLTVPRTSPQPLDGNLSEQTVEDYLHEMDSGRG